MLKEHGQIIAIISSTIVLILVILGAFGYSNYQLQAQLITMQAQVSENQARLAEFIRGHENAHLYIYSDIENEPDTDAGSKKK
ncbi:MAG: hypothetical protein OXF09_07195 [Hyphomicrobiales bacterium]|nr:hypothetical protein [Hyphomicrobiales bacterium]